MNAGLRLLLGMTVWLTACDADAPVWFDFPAYHQGGAEIVAFNLEDRIEFVAVSMDDVVRFPVSPRPDEPVDLSAYVYNRSPAELGIVEGVLRAADEDAPAKRLEPPDLGAYRLSLPGDGSGWIDEDPDDSILDGLRLPFTGCPTFDVHPIPIDTRWAVIGLFAEDDDAVTLVTSSSITSWGGAPRFYRVDRQGAILTTTGVLPEGHDVKAVTRSADGRFWVVATSSGGDSLLVEQDGVFRPVGEPRPEPSRTILDVAADREASDTIYALAAGGRLERYRPSMGWTVLHDADLDDDGSAETIGDISMAGSGEVFAVAEDGRTILHAVGDRIEPLERPLEGEPLVSVIAFPSRAPVVGTLNGHLLELQDTGWTDLGPSNARGRILVAQGYDEGVLFSGYRGDLGIYVPKFGYCESTPTAGIHARAMLRSPSGDIVMAGNAHLDADNTAHVVFTEIRR